MQNTQKSKIKLNKFKQVSYRYAIICTNNKGGEYLYKDYADPRKLQIGVNRFLRNRWKPKSYRLVKLKITTEEEAI